MEAAPPKCPKDGWDLGMCWARWDRLKVGLDDLGGLSQPWRSFPASEIPCQRLCSSWVGAVGAGDVQSQVIVNSDTH